MFTEAEGYANHGKNGLTKILLENYGNVRRSPRPASRVNGRGQVNARQGRGTMDKLFHQIGAKQVPHRVGVRASAEW